MGYESAVSAASFSGVTSISSCPPCIPAGAPCRGFPCCGAPGRGARVGRNAGRGRFHDLRARCRAVAAGRRALRARQVAVAARALRSGLPAGALPRFVGCPARRRGDSSRMARYGHSRNRYVRFFALDDPRLCRAPRGFAPPGRPCRTFFRYRGGRNRDLAAARARCPSLTSRSSLRRRSTCGGWGLCVVRQFGIEEAEPLLLRLLDGEEPYASGAEALFTLCALHRPLVRREVSRCVARLNPSQRRALMRYMAQCSYSPQVLSRLFDDSESAYYDTIVRSYKRCLV